MNTSRAKTVAALLVVALVAAVNPGMAGAQQVEELRLVEAEDISVVKPVEAGNLETSILLRTADTSVITVGDTAWVTVSIRGGRSVDNLRFTALVGQGGSVSYPANTVDHSGPYNGYDLDVKETDYVAFKVTIPDGVTERAAELKLSVTWTDSGKRFKGDTSVKIPLVQFDGAPYTLLTDKVDLTEKDNGWVTLSFAGLAPRVEQLEVSVSSPGDLDIYYPLETFTSLQGDALLEDGETDLARFRINEPSWGQTLDLEVTVKYLVGGVAETASHKIRVAA